LPHISPQWQVDLFLLPSASHNLHTMLGLSLILLSRSFFRPLSPPPSSGFHQPFPNLSKAESCRSSSSQRSKLKCYSVSSPTTLPKKAVILFNNAPSSIPFLIRWLFCYRPRSTHLLPLPRSKSFPDPIFQFDLYLSLLSCLRGDHFFFRLTPSSSAHR